MILFRNRVFANITRLRDTRRAQPGIMVSLTPMTNVNIRERRGRTESQTCREGHKIMEADIGVMLPQTGISENTRI